MEAVAGGIDLLCVGEMGIANTTVAAAIFHALYGGSSDDWVGRGTGVDDAGLGRKADAVAAAVARIGSNREPLEVLRRLGGREIAAMVGAIIAARTERVPVIVDGFVTTAAAAILHALDPRAIDHCLFAHISAEAAHAAVLKRIGKAPLLDLRCGSGRGPEQRLQRGSSSLRSPPTTAWRPSARQVWRKRSEARFRSQSTEPAEGPIVANATSLGFENLNYGSPTYLRLAKRQPPCAARPARAAAPRG